MTTATTSAAAQLASSPRQPAPLPAGFRAGAPAPEVKLTPFYAVGSEPVHLSLTDGGHTAVVYPRDQAPEGTPLHPRFHRLAVTKDCLPMGAEHFTLPTENKAATREQVIGKALQEMLDSTEDGDFTNAGLPNLNNLQRRVGFRVAKDEMEKAWEQVKAGGTQD